MFKRPIIQAKYGFRIGDRVRFVDDRDPDDGVLFDQTGTICTFEGSEDDCIGVRWDKEYGYYHSCSGYCEDRRGWYVPYYSLVGITDLVDLGEIDVDTYGVCDLLFGGVLS